MESQLSPQPLPTEPDGGHPALKESPSQGGGLRLELLYGGGHASDPIWLIASCRPCPTLLQAGPSACWPQALVLPRPFSLKPCPAKCEILSTPPKLPRGASKTLLGATVAWHVLSPSWSWDGYAGGTLCILPHLPRAGPILACLYPTPLQEIDSCKVRTP